MEQSDAEQRKTERERNRKSIIRKRDGWRRDGEEDYARERERTWARNIGTECMHDALGNDIDIMAEPTK